MYELGFVVWAKSIVYLVQGYFVRRDRSARLLARAVYAAKRKSGLHVPSSGASNR